MFCLASDYVKDGLLSSLLGRKVRIMMRSGPAGIVNISGTKRKLDVFSSPTNTRISPLSPPCSPTPSRNSILVVNCRVPAATPVTTAMTTAKWIRTVISPLPSMPLAELERFFSSCDN